MGPGTTIEEGATAPAITLPADTGEDVAIVDDELWTVLYFYPKDDTPGCTTEGIEFTALLDDFEAAGARVLGVSQDSIDDHCAFRDKHELGVTLLSDADGEACEAFDVLKLKKMFGNEFMGIERSTFLIAPGGEVAQEWRKVKAEGHAQIVLDALVERVE